MEQGDDKSNMHRRSFCIQVTINNNVQNSLNITKNINKIIVVCTHYCICVSRMRRVTNAARVHEILCSIFMKLCNAIYKKLE